jgi:hypothetical protein
VEIIMIRLEARQVMVNTPLLWRTIVHRLADALPHSLDDAPATSLNRRRGTMLKTRQSGQAMLSKAQVSIGFWCAAQSHVSYSIGEGDQDAILAWRQAIREQLASQIPIYPTAVVTLPEDS